MEEIEVWKDIPNYEGYYQVSNLGRVKGLKRTVPLMYGRYRVNNEKIIKLPIDSHGYLKCSLCKNGIATTEKAHALVAIAFLGHIPNGNIIVIDHINGCKTDNMVSNLQIVTHREIHLLVLEN